MTATQQNNVDPKSNKNTEEAEVDRKKALEAKNHKSPGKEAEITNKAMFPKESDPAAMRKMEEKKDDEKHAPKANSPASKSEITHKASPQKESDTDALGKKAIEGGPARQYERKSKEDQQHDIKR